LLVLAESYHSGWRAFVDGVARPVYRAYGDFMGCVVEGGRHQVTFVFAPGSLTLGKWLSLIGGAMAVLILFVPVRPARRP
jgi:uncharacterized membrane protein YfhO